MSELTSKLNNKLMLQNHVYIPPVVQELEDFYGTVLTAYSDFKNIGSHLSAIADLLYAGVCAKEPCCLSEINNYHPTLAENSFGKLADINLSLNDCRQTIAAEYGYNVWDSLTKSTRIKYNIPFELAVNTILKGNIEAVVSTLRDNPALTIQQSQYGHGATLLHYCSNNGIEMWRQKVPLNLAAVIETLIDAGADPEAKMKVYNGEFTFGELLSTSAHPYDAGISTNIQHLLSA